MRATTFAYSALFTTGTLLTYSSVKLSKASTVAGSIGSLKVTVNVALVGMPPCGNAVGVGEMRTKQAASSGGSVGPRPRKIELYSPPVATGGVLGTHPLHRMRTRNG